MENEEGRVKTVEYVTVYSCDMKKFIVPLDILKRCPFFEAMFDAKLRETINVKQVQEQILPQEY